jgi:hypothetical protein
MFRTILPIIATLLYAAAEAGPAADAPPPLEIGTRIEPFVDGWLLDRLDRAELRLAAPVRREVVLVTDRPWEGPASAYFTVLRDGPKIRLYYRGLCPVDSSEEQVTCVAESEDGVRFERPEVGLFEFKGSRKNNIVHRGIEAHNLAPFIDRRPGVPAEERYKAVGGTWQKLWAFRSPDGLRWTRLRDEPVTVKGTFDSLNTAYWDEVRGEYLLYSRLFDRGVRAIQSSVSRDFVSWSDPVPNAYPEDAPREHFYTNAVVPCPGAPHILLSFPKRFVPDRKRFADHPDPGLSDGVFLSSRDGVRWDRTFREAWLRPGPEPGNWSDRSNMPAWGIIEIEPGEFTMYASERYEQPGNRLRRLSLRRHGFASLRAGAAGGEATTKPLRFGGSRLLLNYATSAAGSVRVEVLEGDGKPVPGFALGDAAEMFGDALDEPVRWKGGPDISALRGKTVRFRFVLRDADIYAIRTADGER